MKQLKLIGLLLLVSSSLLMAQPYSTISKKTMEDFMGKRFGMFIHWGPVSLRGTEIGWSRNHGVTQSDYDSLYKQFNPVDFDADAWVKTAKETGVKYLTITAKHHDGFCLWPTAYTDYNIMNTPYKKDVVGALAKACKKYGIKFCIYYTVLDWYDRRYPLHNDGNKVPDPKANMPQFVQYMKDQLKELVTNYHPYMLWFDGNWEAPWTLADGKEIYDFLRKLDPNVVINNRLGKGKHTLLNEESVGDYATPEQQIGALNMTTPWESCITLCRQWAWKPGDAMKSLKECIQTLASTAGGNGNLLFNIGPMPDGRIEERQVLRLREIGAWIKKYGEAIYNTKGGPYQPNKVFATTRKGKKIYLHLFQKPGEQLKLAAIPGYKIKKARFLGGPRVHFQQDEGGIALQLPEQLPDENDSVIVLELNKNTEGIAIIGK
ncbi:alpha-L-fucosidase [Niabella hirudinis]|uniref:alpha-L-fucosidase n=1 Tax=Niabella hirudinis TaxID=1285929 RepID=UPI003EBC75C5